LRTENELKEVIQQANRANELFNDPMIQGFILSIRGKLLNEFECTQLQDDSKRKEAWQKSQLLNMFLDEFKKKIKEGRNAELTLSERVKQKLRNII